jgi:hypothetical protein
MNRALLAVGLLLASFNLYGVVEVGERAPNLCWKDVSQKTVCVDDFKNTTRVLVYNAGF